MLVTKRPETFIAIKIPQIKDQLDLYKETIQEFQKNLFGNNYEINVDFEYSWSGGYKQIVKVFNHIVQGGEVFVFNGDTVPKFYQNLGEFVSEYVPVNDFQKEDLSDEEGVFSGIR